MTIPLRVCAMALASFGPGLLLAGCNQAQIKPVAAAAVPVTVARATAENVPTLLQAIGAVQTISTVSVKTLVGGELTTVGFKQGDYVHKGQVLFAIDPQPYQAALAQAEANLSRDEAVNGLAQIESRRYADLVKQGIVSVEQNQQYQYSAASDQATVNADRAAVQTAKLNLGYCTIASPIDGRTGSLLLQAGNAVQPNTTVLVTINQISPIYVAFSVPEQYLLELKQFNAQQPLLVQAQAQGDAQTETGRLSFINNAIDSSTGTIQLMATFPNQDQRLWPGEFVNTEVTLSVADNATVVPNAAVLTGENDAYVYVLTPQRTVENRVVTTGTVMNGYTVVTKGLSPGETVVTDGQVSLYPGAKVLVNQARADLAPAPATPAP